MIKRGFYFLVGVFGVVFVCLNSASAALEFPEIALTDVQTIAAGMLALLGSVWALKKALGFLGR